MIKNYIFFDKPQRQNTCNQIISVVESICLQNISCKNVLFCLFYIKKQNKHNN